MKLGKLFRSELGCNPYVPQRKEFVALVAAGLGLAASAIGAAQSAKAARDAERKQRAQEAKEDAWYNRRYNEDYADTAAGRNLIRRAEQFNKKNWRRAAGAQAVAGGTDAATQMQKDAGNQMMGETLANVAAMDQRRKDNVDNMHRQAESQFAQMDMQRDLQKAQNISNAASQASNAIMQAGSAFENTSSLKGGSNKSIQPMTEATPVNKTPDVAPTISSNIEGGVLGGLGGTTEEQRLAAKRIFGGY